LFPQRGIIIKRAAVEVSKRQEAVGQISDGHREEAARRLIFPLRLILVGSRLRIGLSLRFDEGASYCSSDHPLTNAAVFVGDYQAADVVSAV
jgi:hypothetical protein